MIISVSRSDSVFQAVLKLALHRKVRDGRIGDVEARTISHRKGYGHGADCKDFRRVSDRRRVGAGLGFALFGSSRDWIGISLLLACVGAIIGAIAGTARETVDALRQKPSI